MCEHDYSSNETKYQDGVVWYKCTKCSKYGRKMRVSFPGNGVPYSRVRKSKKERRREKSELSKN